MVKNIYDICIYTKKIVTVHLSTDYAFLYCWDMVMVSGGIRGKTKWKEYKSNKIYISKMLNINVIYIYEIYMK